MPHIIAEYTEEIGLDRREFAVTLHQALSRQETIKEESIKTRLVPVQASVVGTENSADSFIHICLKLLPGRSDELRNTMALALHGAVRSFVSDENISVSVETGEMHAESYVK